MINKVTLLFALVLFFSVSCSDTSKKKASEKAYQSLKSTPVDPMQDKGIGPIKSLDLPATIDQPMVEKGAEIFQAKCSACHKVGKRFIGPSPNGILNKRTPEWIMNMILNPEEMVQKNEAAKKLLAEYLSPMANQNLTVDEARAILEYFRTLE